jgi:hypothetical protein
LKSELQPLARTLQVRCSSGTGATPDDPPTWHQTVQRDQGTGVSNSRTAHNISHGSFPSLNRKVRVGRKTRVERLVKARPFGTLHLLRHMLYLVPLLLRWANLADKAEAGNSLGVGSQECKTANARPVWTLPRLSHGNCHKRMRHGATRTGRLTASKRSRLRSLNDPDFLPIASCISQWIKALMPAAQRLSGM